MEPPLGETVGEQSTVTSKALRMIVQEDSDELDELDDKSDSDSDLNRILTARDRILEGRRHYKHNQSHKASPATATATTAAVTKDSWRGYAAAIRRHRRAWKRA